jgi:hypothetical protein
VCTFPGHWTVMWGKLIVTDDIDAWLQGESAGGTDGRCSTCASTLTDL